VAVRQHARLAVAVMATADDEAVERRQIDVTEPGPPAAPNPPWMPRDGDFSIDGRVEAEAVRVVAGGLSCRRLSDHGLQRVLSRNAADVWPATVRSMPPLSSRAGIGAERGIRVRSRAETTDIVGLLAIVA